MRSSGLMPSKDNPLNNVVLAAQNSSIRAAANSGSWPFTHNTCVAALVACDSLNK